MNGPLCGLIPSEVFQITNDRMRLYELDVVWESICLTVKIQLLSLPIIPVVFLNCEVAHTSFSLNLWTLHNSIWLWLPDKQMLCLFKHVLFIFRMSTKFSHIWWEIQFGQLDLVTLNYERFWWCFWVRGLRREGSGIFTCVCDKYLPWLTQRLVVNITLIVFVHYKKLSFGPVTHLAFKSAMGRLKSWKQNQTIWCQL